MTDDELIEYCRKCDYQAWPVLYDRHKDLVKRVLTEVLEDRASQDLVGTFFWAAMRRIYLYDPGRETFPDWLAGMVRQDAFRHLRGDCVLKAPGPWALPSGIDTRDASPPRTQGPAALAMFLAAATSGPARTVRSEMKPATKVVYRVLSPLILGGCVLAPAALLVLPRDADPEWIAHPLVRAGWGAGLLFFALWLSARLSRLLEWVELDLMHLRWKRLWAPRVRQESMGDLKKIHADGTIEFSNGRKIHFDGHVPERAAEIARRISWWHKHGMRNAEPPN